MSWITDKLPADDREVLISLVEPADLPDPDGNGTPVWFGYWNEKERCWFTLEGDEVQVVAWMPLPEAYKR